MTDQRRARSRGSRRVVPPATDPSRVRIPPAAAERLGKLMAAAEVAQFNARLYMQALADMAGVPLEQIRGVDDGASELIVIVPDPPAPEAPEETT